MSSVINCEAMENEVDCDIEFITPIIKPNTAVENEIPQPPPIAKKLNLTYVIGDRHMFIVKNETSTGYYIAYHLCEKLREHVQDECFTHEISGNFILVNFTKQELEQPLKLPLPYGLCDFSNTLLDVKCNKNAIIVGVITNIIPNLIIDEQCCEGLLLENGNRRYPINVVKIQLLDAKQIAGIPVTIFTKSKFDGFDTIIRLNADREIIDIKYEREYITVIYKPQPYPKQFTYIDGEYEKYITKQYNKSNGKMYYKCHYGVDKELYAFLRTPISLSTNIVGKFIHINHRQNSMRKPLILPLPNFPFEVSNDNWVEVKIQEHICRVSVEIKTDENIELCHYTKAQIDLLNGLQHDKLVFEKNVVTNPCKSIIRRNQRCAAFLTKSVFDGFDTDIVYNFVRLFKNVQEHNNKTVFEFETKVEADMEPTKDTDEIPLPPAKKHKQTHFDGNDIIEIDETKNTIQFSHAHADKTHELTFAKPPEIKNAENGGWDCLLHFANFDTCRDITSIEIDMYFGKMWIFLYADFADGTTIGRVANVVLPQSIANKNLNATGQFYMESNSATINITEAK